jgi:site-specific DNA-methyltransferase (adenine-specific)
MQPARSYPVSPPVPHAIPAASIVIPERRQRTELDPEALGELAESIRRIGLQHPIVIRMEAGVPTLMSGERRLKACRMLGLMGVRIKVGGHDYPPGHVPVTNFGDMNPIDAHEAELEENIRRVDLSLQDRVRAIAELHNLRASQKLLSPSEDAVQTVADTAREVFPDMTPAAAQGKVFNSLEIARHLDNPDVAKAKTEKEAMKIIGRVKQADQNRRLAAVVGTKSVNELHEVYHADCTDWLAAAPDARFDCILIDPPYGMDAAGFGDGAGRLTGITHDYIDDSDSFRSLMEVVAPDLTRVAKPESHLYVWCDIDGFHFLRELFQNEGWWVFRTPLVNIKREGGRVPWPEHGPRRCYELALFAVRGKRPVTGIYRDVFESTLEDSNVGHGAQKPVEAYVELLKRTCRPGDTVLDCFAGTGTILAAAHALGLRSVAVEKDANAYGMCLKRLEGMK